MIAHINGTVSEKCNNTLIVDVNGIGYEVQVSSLEYEANTTGEMLKLYTYHHVREQSEELFGFSTLTGKKMFEMLITVQGIGPKAALSILSLGDGEAVRNAIANSDAAYIQKATGVGKKTAERVVVDLADKVGLPTSYQQTEAPISAPVVANDEALEALMALGYTLADASKALEGVDAKLPTAARVTQALKG